MVALAVPTATQRHAAHVFPVLRTWALVQQERAQLAVSVSSLPSRGASPEQSILQKLMRCPVDEVIVLVLSFAYA